MLDRNEPCPCGSGRKYKHCHGGNVRRASVPGNPDQLLRRARELARQGRLDESIRLFEKLPSLPPVLHHYFNVLLQRGFDADLRKADQILMQKQKLLPNSADVQLKRAEIQWLLAKPDEALRLVRGAGKTDPGHPRVEYYLGVALQLAGQLDAALDAYRIAIQKNAREPLSELEMDIEAAIEAYETAAGFDPVSTAQNPQKLVNAEAEYFALQSALSAWQNNRPEHSGLSEEQVTRYGNAHYNLGCSDMVRFNCLRRAAEHFKACLAINPGHVQARCNHLFLLNYDEKITAEEIFRAHVDATKELRRIVGPALEKFHNNPNPDKPLKIAYLSSDFRKHSVIHFITPILAAHDRSRCQVYAYYNGRKQDQWTREVRSLVDVLDPVALLDDRQLQQKIINDGIDILVDLNGYSKGHRASMLMRRAAPIQVSWLGYPSTSGMDVMDYRIVDSITDPEGPEPVCSETLIRMPDVFSVYLPEAWLPPVRAETPALVNGYTTFGSFNFLTKLNPGLLQAWSEILAGVSGSRLLIKNMMLSQPVIRRDLEYALGAAGIDSSRVSLEGRTESVSGHMAFFNEVDLCLDSWPYNGTTTTCDSLIMGVPVLTIAGDSHRSRVGASQLRAVGLHRQLVATDRDDYVRIGIKLASDSVMLNNLRQGLTERLQQSPLMDAKTFTRELENRYREIWQRWCEQER